MSDYIRGSSFELNMSEGYQPSTPPAPARLDDFQVFKKGTAHIYDNYYTNAYDEYIQPEIKPVYQILVNREFRHDDWKCKYLVDWTEDDTLSWVLQTAQCHGISEFDVPFYNFRIPGYELKMMKPEDFHQRMMTHYTEPGLTKKMAELLYDKLQQRLHDEMYSDRNSSVYRYGDRDLYQHPDSAQTVLDLDSVNHKNRHYHSDYRSIDKDMLQYTSDLSNDEDAYCMKTGSPESGSEGSISEDKDMKCKTFKRPPGRPKGSGKKLHKGNKKQVSVPEFLRNLLLDERYNPSIIKWENRDEKKFRFVNAEQVAKLWGKIKGNDNMNFEKFSRAMRYHYKQNVLAPVPTARLVYQFGTKCPDLTISTARSTTCVGSTSCISQVKVEAMHEVACS